MTSKVQARVTRRFEAAPERVFAAWLDPELVGIWMTAMSGEMVRVATDARVGGSFSFVVRRGEQEIDHTGDYMEVDRPRRLVFTWMGPASAPESARITIDIVPLETGCELTLVHEMGPEWADFVPRAEASWGKMIDAIAGALR